MSMTKNNEVYNYRTAVDDNNKELPIIKSNKTNTSLSLMSKAVNKVKDDNFLNTDTIGVIVDKNDTTVLLTVINKIADEPISPFDLSVHNTVCTLYNENNTHFTAKMIAQKLIGKSTKPSKNLIRDVELSLYKMGKTYIGIDHEEQYNSWNKEAGNDEEVETNIKMRYMLQLDIDLKIKLNNNVTSAFRLNRTPPLLEYTKVYRQLASTKDELIDTSGYLTHNSETIAIKEYLKNRIEVFESMRSRNKKFNTTDISYKKLYEELKKGYLIQPGERSENRKKLLNHVTNILEAFKHNGWIKSYSHSGNTINGKVAIGKILHDDKYI